LLLLPALWNGFPLLQWDTGGYLARWYEGTLAVSRSTVYGLFLYALQAPNFWPVVVLQSGIAAWIIALVLRRQGLTRPHHMLLAVLALTLCTSLPWLTSILLTDIFAGLSVLAAYLAAFEKEALGRYERVGLIAVMAAGAASHSATLLLLVCLGLAGACAALPPARLMRLRQVAPVAGAVALGAALLLVCNYALVGRIAWTPGGPSILFARMLEDGFVKRYLKEHCPDPSLRLCPYRDRLPDGADAFLWGGGGNSIFNRLGRFTGLGDEMRTIAFDSLTEYPVDQLEAAVSATARQLVEIGSGEGVVPYLPHTQGIIARFTPQWAAAMRAARQQAGEITLFPFLNAVQVPVALGSALLLLGLVVRAARERRFTSVEMLAAAVLLALVANAAICGIFSNPHPRYGARLAWLAPLVVLLMALSLAERVKAAQADARIGLTS
jgi:hypothetical protein